MREERIELEALRYHSNRSHGGEGDVKILAEDIKLNGLINPITVKPFETDDLSGYFEVVAGRRRVGAVTLLGWKDVSCRVLEGDEIERADEIAGAENINRLAMHPLDEAAIFQKLLEHGDTIEDLAKRFDRKVSEIWQRIQLLELNDGIKDLFRNGRIDLHAAAMLKSLDAEQQQAFVDKSQKHKAKISIYDVRSFISAVSHNRLYNCITGKECAKCKKRTFYNDKALFPELGEEDDVCLDNECYMGKWQKFLSAKFKAIKAKNESHIETNIIVCQSDELRKIFGKSITIDGVEFSVVKFTWNNPPAEKPTKASKPCFKINLGHKYTGADDEEDDEFDESKFEEVISCIPLYYKEPEKKKSQNDSRENENPFIPVVKFLDMPKEESEQLLAALTGKANTKTDYWMLYHNAGDIERKVKNKVLERIIDVAVKKPENETDIDRFLSMFLDRGSNKGTIKKFTGSNNLSDVKKLSLPKMFAALYASTLNGNSLPDLDQFGKGLKYEIAQWAGIPISQLKEMYLEELKSLMPKPAALKKEVATEPTQTKKAVKGKKK